MDTNQIETPIGGGSPSPESDCSPVWAIVELMGHVRYGGLVSKDTQFGTAMLRVDVPQRDGSMVSQLINPASLYRVTFCDEVIARAAAANGQSRPMEPWEMRHLLPAPSEPVDSPGDDYHDPDDPDGF